MNEKTVTDTYTKAYENKEMLLIFFNKHFTVTTQRMSFEECPSCSHYSICLFFLIDKNVLNVYLVKKLKMRLKKSSSALCIADLEVRYNNMKESVRYNNNMKESVRYNNNTKESVIYYIRNQYVFLNSFDKFAVSLDPRMTIKTFFYKKKLCCCLFLI